MSASQYVGNRQPDILEVISNLSNNEVFTPPRVANDVLDLLPEHVWNDPTLRWLDPASKTGVFPREITRRLMVGLSGAIPDESERLRHILTAMVHAVAITDMTAMMSRRSLYCSKDADSEHSAIEMMSSSGNVWNDRVEHAYDQKGKCSECGGSREQLETSGRDNYAYALIHSDGQARLAEAIDMKFDIIVGNPPYQMELRDSSDVPLYNLFIEQSIALNPKFITMVIPSRWMAGGKWLEGFRAKMLADKRLRKLVDFSLMASVFPGSVDFEGGVCYFLWDRDSPGECEFIHHVGSEALPSVERDLNEFDVLVRDNRSLSILRKVRSRGEPSIHELVTGQTPFGLFTNFKDYRKKLKRDGDLKLIVTDGGVRTEKWVDPKWVTRGHDLVKKWKVFVPKAYGERGAVPARVLGPTYLAGPGTVCTQTFLAVGPFRTKAEAESAERFLATRLARFLISLRKITQDAGRGTYAWVPQLDWGQSWSDADLAERYGLTRDEQAHIESMVKELPV